jgi:hypothetical protein
VGAAPPIEVIDDVPLTRSGELPRGKGQLESSCGSFEEAEVLYQWTPDETGTYRLAVESGADTVMYILAGDGPDCGEELSCNDDADGSNPEIIQRFEAGVPVLIVIEPYDASARETFQLVIDP